MIGDLYFWLFTWFQPARSALYLGDPMLMLSTLLPLLVASYLGIKDIADERRRTRLVAAMSRLEYRGSSATVADARVLRAVAVDGWRRTPRWMRLLGVGSLIALVGLYGFGFLALAIAG